MLNDCPREALAESMVMSFQRNNIEFSWQDPGSSPNFTETKHRRMLMAIAHPNGLHGRLCQILFKRYNIFLFSIDFFFFRVLNLISEILFCEEDLGFPASSDPEVEVLVYEHDYCDLSEISVAEELHLAGDHDNKCTCPGLP